MPLSSQAITALTVPDLKIVQDYAPNNLKREAFGVLRFAMNGRPTTSIANPEIESFFELSIIPASSPDRI